jgi:hypothetical protein
MPFVSGLDLGQRSDPSALCVCEQAEGPDPLRPGVACWHYRVRYLRRWQLGTLYTEVGEQVRETFAQPPLPGSFLAVDQTGVVRAVVDLLRGLSLPCGLCAVTITAGEQARQEGLDWHAPKRELVGTLQSLLQTGRLSWSAALPLAEELSCELASFRVKQSARTGHESFGALREGDHDDLVLALARACWLGERSSPWDGSGIGVGGGEAPPPGVFEDRPFPTAW